MFFQLVDVQIAALHFFCDVLQGLVQVRRFQPLFLCQVGVTGRKSQPVICTPCFGSDDFGRQSELLGHVTNDHQLLVILLAENGNGRIDAGKEFQQYGRHAVEKAGTGFAFQNVGQFLWRLDTEFLRYGIHVFFSRGEKNVHPFFFQFFDVCLECTGIGVEIFVRAELQAVDEDGCDDRIAVFFGKSHQ